MGSPEIASHCEEAKERKRTMENEGKGMRLLKKGQKGLVHALFSRLGIFIILLILQAGVMFAAFSWFAEHLPRIWGGSIVLTAVIVMYILNTAIDPTAKLTWLIMIMLVPVFGVLLFIFTQSSIGHRMMAQRTKNINQQSNCLCSPNPETEDRFAKEYPDSAGLLTYLKKYGGSQIYDDTQITFFPLGEYKFKELLKQLEAAEKFIFMEYFIIEEGLMWGEILDILVKKAAQGVDVRVMYDGTCEFSTLPRDYPQRLKKLGIKCKVFSPLTPFFSTHYNYRDHRKILVIDGHTAFNGGINLADEYINEIEKHGHWKDTAVMLKGSVANRFTLMFLQMWNMDEKTVNFDAVMPDKAKNASVRNGYVVPFGDCPLDNDKVGERVYMDILNRAKKYVHIMSPYLILDGEMETALKFAAERGVDVKLILPGVPDKAAPYSLAKSYYKSLLDSGVEIYEYTPGFVHAKLFVSDDKEAVVGTINLDYRSLYHHFECATWMVGSACIGEIEEDYRETLEKCRKVTKETIWEGKCCRILGFILKAVAPLM